MMWVCRALLLGIIAASRASGAAVTPVQKVIQLLTGMVEKGKSEKNAEQIQFATYKSWCDNTQREKQEAIASSSDKLEDLQADIAKYESDANQYGEEIAALDTDIATWTGDTLAAQKVREIENLDYTTTHKDYTESIEAISEGMATMKKQHHDVAQGAASLAQLKEASYITPQAKRAIESYLSQDNSIPDENLAMAAPEAKAHESGLQGMLDMMEKLSAKFDDERTDLEKQEMESKHAFEMLSMDLKTQLDGATEARTGAAEKKADALQMAADARGGLMDAQTTRDDDSKYLADLSTNCELKSSDFADRQDLRQKELEALGKAVDILGGGKVAGASEKHLPQLLQKKAASLAQLRHVELAPSQKQMASFLRRQGQKMNSRLLSMMAERVEADPFKKVKKMVKDLIVKLMEEAAGEVETKGFCDKELKTNEHTRKEKTALVEQLTADIDELGASIAILAEDIAKISTELVELGEAVNKATNQRLAESAKNRETINDAKDAQVAVGNALTVLKEFYDSAAEATALIQLREPEIFDEPYKGMGAESGGILGMIEVIGSDFMRLEAETSAEEESAGKAYQGFMDDSAVDKAQKTKDVEHKTEKRASQEAALQEKKSDLAGTEKELTAALETFEKLKPSCIAGGSESYEDRVAQRKEEIESLQEALRILNGEDIAL